MKNKHGLSGIYFRQKNTETGKMEPVVFEDLEREKQDEILNNPELETEYYKQMIKMLADTLYQIAEEFDIYSSTEKPEVD
jgi:hypothetical protein